MKAFLLTALLVPSVSAQEAVAKPDELASAFDRIGPLVKPLLDGKVAVGLVVGILSNGESKVRGYGRVAADRDGAPEGKTVYEIGSITKVFTGILLGDAATRGLVDLDDPVQKHLSADVKVPDFNGKPIRLLHLSTHTSALPRMPANFKTSDHQNPYRAYNAKQLHAGVSKTELTRAPGEKYAYSNFGVGLLGHILHTVQNKKSYEELVLERICAPLDLADTRLTLNESMRERLAPPYDDAGQRTANWDFDSLAGCGAIRSTANDMLRFAAASLEPKSLTGKRAHLRPAIESAIKAHHEPAFTARLSGQPTLGLGWHFAGANVVWHNGGTGGYRTHLRLDTARKTVVLILANTTSRRIDELAGQIGSVLRGRTVKPMTIPIPVKVPLDVLKRYVGRYQLAPNAVFDIKLENGTLSARLTGQPWLPVFPTSQTRFNYRAVKAAIEFEEKEGAVTGLVLHQHGRISPAKRLADKRP